MIVALALLLQVTAADPAVVQRARPDENTISFHAAAVPDTLSVGQQAIYQVAVFVPEEVRQRLRRNPEFIPPELRAIHRHWSAAVLGVAEDVLRLAGSADPVRDARILATTIDGLRLEQLTDPREDFRALALPLLERLARVLTA